MLQGDKMSAKFENSIVDSAQLIAKASCDGSADLS
jgi:hypothetical protein